MRDRKYRRRYRPIAAIIIGIFIILSGIIFAVSNNDDSKAAKNVSAKQRQGLVQEDEEVGTVAGATVVAPTETQTSAPTTPTANKKKAAAVPPASTTAQTQTITQPSNPTPPQNPQVPADGPVDEVKDEYITVAVGGASESYTLATEDGSLVYWYSCNAGVAPNDETLPDKPAYKTYLVLETGVGPAPSITFHVRALPTAVPGLYEGSTQIESTGLGFCLYNANNEPVDSIKIPVRVVPA